MLHVVMGASGLRKRVEFKLQLLHWLFHQCKFKVLGIMPGLHKFSPTGPLEVQQKKLVRV